MAPVPHSFPLREDAVVTRMYKLGLWDERTPRRRRRPARPHPAGQARDGRRARAAELRRTQRPLRPARGGAARAGGRGRHADRRTAARLPGCTLLPACTSPVSGSVRRSCRTAWRGAGLRPLLATVGAAVLVVPGAGGIAGDDFDFPRPRRGALVPLRRRRAVRRARQPADRRTDQGHDPARGHPTSSRPRSSTWWPSITPSSSPTWQWSGCPTTASATPDLAGLCAFLRDREVALVKLPRGARPRPPLPTNAGGKVDKAQVRDRAVQELRSRSAAATTTVHPATEGTA